MCVIFHFKDGKDVESVEDFEQHFNVDAEDYLDPMYGKIEKDFCLCQIDIDKFVDEKGIREKFEFNGDYWEL